MWRVLVHFSPFGRILNSKSVGTPFTSTGKVQFRGNIWVSDFGFVSIADFGFKPFYITRNVARGSLIIDI